MKRLFQLILIIFLTTTSTTSYAFFSKIKALQGIGVFFKTKVFKLGAATEGARVVDNVTMEALNFRKIDKKLINKFSNQKEKPLMGVLRYLGSHLKSFNLSENDLIGFTPNSEYEFIIDNEKLYRVPINSIAIKYERKGTEVEYNPSWV